jgi:hypothetical protein
MITGGHDLPNPCVIHCLGPVYGEDAREDAREDEILDPGPLL